MQALNSDVHRVQAGVGKEYRETIIMVDSKKRPGKDLDRIDRNILNELQKDGRISNVELSKQNALQAKTIMELTGEVRVLNSKILLEESINDDLQKRINQKYPKKPTNKRLKR